MKCDVFFILGSFNFNGPVDELFEKLTEASFLVGKMNSDKFIRFSKSSDFYNDVVSKLYGPQAIPEAGAISSLVYDGKFNLANNREFDSAEVLEIVNQALPIEDQRWVSVFGILPTAITITYPIRNVKNERDIIDFSKDIIRNNGLSTKQCANAFEGIYRNLIFHPQYNDLDNITGGYVNFLEGIFEMFDEMNHYEPKDGDPKSDIDYLDKRIKFTTCEEGGAKKHRKGDEKLDFNFTIDGVTTSYNCEYHCKLEYFDKQYKKGHYHTDNRMYFGFYKPKTGTNKFLIAHLGNHL
ncbi:hypothetical protein Q9L41_17060 [Vibrio cholerae]|uniref:hypothetical protein n=1 Tax=Vibrio cholerae TaxID=666 RepID=UPI001158D72C|nr:hypothetical protein [Vibrio cholerae]MDP4497516.1 hypothetical protein [Vibrio cholerae]TQQ57233.1 hypothetical protein FLL62_00495 [Vibrio cholerae]WLP78629.1 hypothetical protein Q9L40_01025 [Vibrio cholerae]